LKDKPDVRVPLLDRLWDTNPWAQAEFVPLRSYSLEEYRNSVLRDLGFLLNTKSPVTAAEFDKENLTVLEYGTPDFAHYSPENEDDRILIARRIEHAIRNFEPRLRNPYVSVVSEMLDEKVLSVKISAELIAEKSHYSVTILTRKQIYSGKWEVYETTWE